MTDISDFVNAAPQIQTAVSFAGGFIAGAILRYRDREHSWKNGGGLVGGGAMALFSQGAPPNYVWDMGAASVGDYLGSKFTDKIVKYLG